MHNYASCIGKQPRGHCFTHHHQTEADSHLLEPKVCDDDNCRSQERQRRASLRHLHDRFPLHVRQPFPMAGGIAILHLD